MLIQKMFNYISLLLVALLVQIHVTAQTNGEKLAAAISNLQKDSLLQHATISLYVVNTATNQVLYDLNSQVGVVPASCQKILTSIAAFDILGKDFRYKTTIGYNGTIKKNTLKGDLIIKGYGDPTLGSWRYAHTSDTSVWNGFYQVLKQMGIKKIKGNIQVDQSYFSKQPVPNGWPWEDIGNYYGAGSWSVNWHENQYDLSLLPSKTLQDSATLLATEPPLPGIQFSNLTTTTAETIPTNLNLFSAPYSHNIIVDGTIAQGDKPVKTSGAMPDPSPCLLQSLLHFLQDSGIILDSKYLPTSVNAPDSTAAIWYVHQSPTLDSINYWYLRKSVNLYGEALLKTIAKAKGYEGRTDQGLMALKQFWIQRGISSSALRLLDGSGLSPQNRTTTHALVHALLYARQQTWFPSFYDALPLYNGMKLKSGTISGFKGFTGYHTDKSGNTYAIAFIINNFQGSATQMVKKMYLVLDTLL